MVRKPEDTARSPLFSDTRFFRADGLQVSHGSHGKVNHKEATMLPEGRAGAHRIYQEFRLLRGDAEGYMRMAFWPDIYN